MDIILILKKMKLFNKILIILSINLAFSSMETNFNDLEYIINDYEISELNVKNELFHKISLSGEQNFITKCVSNYYCNNI